MLPKVLRHADPDALCDAAAKEVAAMIQFVQSVQGHCALALAGGRTPRGIYERLARRCDLDWSNVELVFGDERAVPPDDPQSNYRMVSEALLAHLPQSPDERPLVHRIEGELGAVEAARRYSEVITKLGVLDIVLLGMGDDGHVASVFPGGPAADPPGEQPAGGDAVIATTSPQPPHERISVTLPWLAHARVVMMLVTGEGKAARLAEVLEQIRDGRAVLPAARLAGYLPAQATFRWHIDEAASSHLKEGSA